MTDPEQTLPKSADAERKTGFTITAVTCYNSLGEKVPEAEFREERNAFETQLEEQYEARITEILKSVVEFSPGNKWQQAAKIFEYLVNNVQYDHDIIFNEHGFVYVKSYQIYNKWGVGGDTKYAPILVGKGVCAGFVPVVNDLLSRIGVRSYHISGQTRIVDAKKGTRAQHGWNIVDVDGEFKHLDLTYALYNQEEGRNPFEYFLITNEQLRQLGPHTGYEEELAAMISGQERGGGL